LNNKGIDKKDRIKEGREKRKAGLFRLVLSVDKRRKEGKRLFPVLIVC